MDMKVFLDNAKQVIALHVADLLAAGDGKHFALDLEDGRAIGEFDAEAVAGEGEDLFFEYEGFGLLGDELRENRNGLRNTSKTGHSCWTKACGEGCAMCYESIA